MLSALEHQISLFLGIISMVSVVANNLEGPPRRFPFVMAAPKKLKGTNEFVLDARVLLFIIMIMPFIRRVPAASKRRHPLLPK
jgi:hypothetical protein